VDFHPAGDKLASGGGDGQVRIWEIGKGRSIVLPEQHSANVRTVRFNSKGDLLASGSKDGQIFLWDVAKNYLCTKLSQEHTDGVRTLAFSPDGYYLASGAEDCTIRVWDTKARKCVCSLPNLSTEIWAVTFTPDGQAIVSGGTDGSIHIWEWRTGKIISRQEAGGGIFALACSPSGGYLAAAGEDRRIRFFKLEGSQLSLMENMTSNRYHKRTITGLVFLNDETIISSGRDGILCFNKWVSKSDPRKLRGRRLYEGLSIWHTEGITEYQRQTLLALGATEDQP
jgi:WD40 repeat protein